MMAGRLAAFLALSLFVSGCGSIAKGVTEAVLEQGEAEDTRACFISGPKSVGIEALLRDQENERSKGASTRTMKMLMIHGIGKHIPGYSGRLTEYLMRELGLDVTDEQTKELTLSNPLAGSGPGGFLRISRFTNKSRTRELLFYELTWSEITEPEKKVLEYDVAGEYSFRRTALNNAMKEFVNSHASDPLIYLGRSRNKILMSVQQSFCWMTQGDWDYYQRTTNETCDLAGGDRAQQMREDDYAVVTHSLGSRIIIDTLQWLAETVLERARADPKMAELSKVFQNKKLYIFMLANQLPLLELGREPAAVREKIDAYCKAGGEFYDQRMFRELVIQAFSDPNDVLSYALPPKFAHTYLDSRLCPRVTNIILNIAHPTSMFGLTDFANPLEAHVGYDHDERVIALMAHGIGHGNEAQIIKDRCDWLETATD